MKTKLSLEEVQVVEGGNKLIVLQATRTNLIQAECNRDAVLYWIACNQEIGASLTNPTWNYERAVARVELALEKKAIAEEDYMSFIKGVTE